MANKNNLIQIVKDPLNLIIGFAIASVIGATGIVVNNLDDEKEQIRKYEQDEKNKQFHQVSIIKKPDYFRGQVYAPSKYYKKFPGPYHGPVLLKTNFIERTDISDTVAIFEVNGYGNTRCSVYVPKK